MRQQTWFACITCVAAVILPGLIVGALAAFVYRVTTGFQIGSDPDFYFMRTLFNFAAPGQIIKWIEYSAIPSAIHGGVAGAVAMMLTGLICKGSRYEIAAFVTGAFYTGFMVLIIGLGLVIKGFDVQMLEVACEIVGLWIGLFAALESLPTPVHAPTG